jgi:hypothetical protein
VTVPFDLEDERVGLETLLADVLRSAFGEEPAILPLGLPALDLTVEPAAGTTARTSASPNGPDAGEAAPPAYALLAISDEAGGGLLGVQVRLPGRLAHALAVRMFASDSPSADDLLDAVGELTNILGGNVKALLFTRSAPGRLSLPSAVLGRPGDAPPARHAAPTPRDGALVPAGGGSRPTTICARVLGDVAEVTLIPRVQGGDFVWPPLLDSAVLEGQP